MSLANICFNEKTFEKKMFQYTKIKFQKETDCSPMDIICMKVMNYQMSEIQ
jgi:hypothetical protein